MKARGIGAFFATVSLISTFAFAEGAGAGMGRADMPGFALMTPAERDEHRAKMRGFTRYDDCAAYLAQHHQLMLERAKAKGTTLPAMPQQTFCDRMKASGQLK
jgi:hypothetical protein